MIPYQDLTPDTIELPERTEAKGYIRPPFTDQTFVPDTFGTVRSIIKAPKAKKNGGKKNGGPKAEAEKAAE